MGKLNYISGKRCLVRFVIRTLETVAVSGGLGNRESGRGGGVADAVKTFWNVLAVFYYRRSPETEPSLCLRRVGDALGRRFGLQEPA